MLDLRMFTVKQLLMAAGIARKMKPSMLSSMLNIDQSYITKQRKDAYFEKLITLFQALPVDDDTKIMNGVKTLGIMAAQLMYNSYSKNDQ